MRFQCKQSVGRGGYAVTRKAGRLIVAPAIILLIAGLASPALASPAPAASGATRASFLARVLNGRGHYLHRGSNGEADVNVCSDAVPAGYAHCNAWCADGRGGRQRRPRRLRPGIPAVGVQRAVGHERSRTDGRDRRRLRRPDGRERSRHVPLPVRPAGVHDRQRLFQQGRPGRHEDLPGRRRRVGQSRSRSTSTW